MPLYDWSLSIRRERVYGDRNTARRTKQERQEDTISQGMLRMPATMTSKKEPGRTPPGSQGKVCGLLTPSFAAGNPQGHEDSIVAKVIPSLEYFVTATLENESLISHSLTRAQQKARWQVPPRWLEAQCPVASTAEQSCRFSGTAW